MSLYMYVRDHGSMQRRQDASAEGWALTGGGDRDVDGVLVEQQRRRRAAPRRPAISGEGDLAGLHRVCVRERPRKHT